MFPMNESKVRLVGVALAVIVPPFALVGVALAQSGHFIDSGRNVPMCVDMGTTVTCSGKVAGLGGTTFEITIEAAGTAIIECSNGLVRNSVCKPSG